MIYVAFPKMVQNICVCRKIVQRKGEIIWANDKSNEVKWWPVSLSNNSQDVIWIIQIPSTFLKFYNLKRKQIEKGGKPSSIEVAYARRKILLFPIGKLIPEYNGVRLKPLCRKLGIIVCPHLKRIWFWLM